MMTEDSDDRAIRVKLDDEHNQVVIDAANSGLSGKNLSFIVSQPMWFNLLDGGRLPKFDTYLRDNDVPAEQLVAEAVKAEMLDGWPYGDAHMLPSLDESWDLLLDFDRIAFAERACHRADLVPLAAQVL